MFNGCQAEPVEALEKVIVKKLKQLNNFKNNRSMTKTFMMLGATLSMSFAYGQEYNRVGINTEVPQATLDVRETPLSLLPTGTPQGVLFPNFSSDERTAFTANVKEGTMIYNTDLDCVEQYTFRNNKLDWYCSCLCDENTAVIEQDDEVIIRLNSIYRTVEIEDMFRIFPSSNTTGQLFPVFRNGQILEENDGDGGMSYEAQEDGRYTEKRYPIKLYGFTNITMNDASFDGRYYNVYRSMETIDANIVIPAGRVTKGTGIIPVYLELPSGINTIHTGDGLIQTITVGGKEADIVYEFENEE